MPLRTATSENHPVEGMMIASTSLGPLSAAALRGQSDQRRSVKSIRRRTINLMNSLFSFLFVAALGIQPALAAPVVDEEGNNGGKVTGSIRGALSPNIIGGVSAPEFREGVVIRKDGKDHCSGALVAPDMVLTAGHCIHALNAEQITLEFPHNRGIIRNARELINICAAESLYDETPLSENEVALIRLDADLNLGSYPYPTLAGAVLGEDVRSLGMIQDGVAGDGEMFISSAQPVFAHDDNYYGTNSNVGQGGDSGGPMFTTDVVPGTSPNVIVAVTTGSYLDNDWYARVDSQMDLIKSYVNPPTCSEYSSDVVRLQMHQLKMIRKVEWGRAELRYRVTFGGQQSDWSDVTGGIKNGQTLPESSPGPFTSESWLSLTQYATSHEGMRIACIPGKIEVQEVDQNFWTGRWNAKRRVQKSMTYCYDANDDRWELQGTDETQGSANLKDGKFEIDLQWKAVRTRACSRTVNQQLVRLKHVNSGKCAYNSLPVDGGTVNNWVCWNDPNMMYVLDPLPQHGANAVRVRHLQSNSCWYAGQNNGDPVAHWSCWNDPNFVYFIDDIGNGQVRLRHKDSKRCAYGRSENGGYVKSWGCWNDPNMRYEILPQ